MEERLQKYMARCGVASRRSCEELILQGTVKVNGNIIKELGCKINPDKDIIEYNKKIIKPENRKVYIILNKPVGYVSTVKDERGRKTIIDLVNVDERIFPIGRLDYDSSGLIILTNDGEIYNRVIHPRQEIDKTYEALLKGIPDIKDINDFCNGIDIGGYITAKAKFQILKLEEENAIANIIIHEGKNRQIRRMCEKINHPILSLRRISIGMIELGKLQTGKWRYLNEQEIDYLKNI